MLVYKYRCYGERTLEILLNRQLYFSPIGQLNDPLDANVDIRSEYLRALESCTPTSDIKMALRPVMLRTLNTYKYSKADGADIVGLYDVAQHFINSAGILSLSRVQDDALLWSHYAAGHSGLCLGFNSEALVAAQKPVVFGPVTYAPAPPLNGVFLRMADELRDAAQRPEAAPHARKLFHDKQLHALLTTSLLSKSVKWNYEEEYRLILNPSGNYNFPAEALRSITFGANASLSAKSTIRKVLSAPEYAHVELFATTHAHHRYSFAIQQLERE